MLEQLGMITFPEMGWLRAFLVRSFIMPEVRPLPEELMSDPIVELESVRSVLKAGIREQHSLLRIFFAVPTTGQTRAQWAMVLFNVLCVQALSCFIFFQRTQPSLVA